MALDGVTQAAYVNAAILSCILTLIFILQHKHRTVHWSLVFAAAMQSAWGLGLVFSHLWQAYGQLANLLETARACAWIFATTATMEYYCKPGVPKVYKRFIYGACAIAVLVALLQTLPLPLPLGKGSSFAWQGLLLAILGLLSSEQLYRNIINVRLVKILCLNIAVLFMYDVYFFTQALLESPLGKGHWQSRAGLVMASSVLMGIATITLNHPYDHPAKLTFSRPVVFYFASLLLAVALIALITLGGYYIEGSEGSWGLIAYIGILLATVSGIGYLFIYKHVRDKLAVLINKHFFSHKYDYRAEWLKLIEHLSQPKSSEQVHAHALSAVTSIFKSPGGAIWMRRGKLLLPVYQRNINVNLLDVIEPESSNFIQTLEQYEWVFLPGASPADESLLQYNEHLPGWVNQVQDIWLILPLMSETQLVGFIVLTTPATGPSLNWEDLDLLKTVGRQVANYLRRHEQSEQLAEARQFDAFNKLAAYVMHDLKNLIAQQSLVVKNAEKHKDNPAFVEDAIQTINNSVSRMNNLLRKLQRNEPESTRVLNLNDVLIEAIRRTQKSQPQPTLRNDMVDLRVKGDFDSLAMVFVHLIQNAQDATPSSGFIDVSVRAEGEKVSISIEDNGEGMDQEFIRDRLFKPFETTKTGKGMGIGVYQARDYVQNLGGHIAVESTPDEGSTFVINLPTVGVATVSAPTLPRDARNADLL